MTIAPMTPEHAREIAAWAYPGEYALYDFSPEEEAELLNGEYYCALDEGGALVGFFCYGASARIPADGDAYARDALDFGLGMRPDLCGLGGGAAFVRAGLAYAREALGVDRFRLAVASFNQRAARAYEKAGFRRVSAVRHLGTGMEFWMMERDASDID